MQGGTVPGRHHAAGGHCHARGRRSYEGAFREPTRWLTLQEMRLSRLININVSRFEILVLVVVVFFMAVKPGM